MSIPPTTIMNALKADIPPEVQGQDIETTFEILCALIPDAPRIEIVETLVDMRIKVTNPAQGRVLIPGHYFL